jgi:hypothetical protein
VFQFSFERIIWMDLHAHRLPSPRRAAAVLIGALLALAATACSSSAGKAGSSSSSSQPVATSTAASTSAAVSTPSSPQLTAADIAAITKAYTTFFNTNSPLAASMAVLQDGPAFKDALVQQAKSPAAQGTTATVSKVTAQTANTAVVTFTIIIKGSPVLKDTPGFAVREKGAWKVAGGTFCGLLTLNGGAPPVCKTAAATSLPG